MSQDLPPQVITGAAIDPKPRRPPLPKWESETRERVKAGIRSFQKPLAAVLARDANEGDTRLLVTDILCDLLGYDKYADLATEFMVRGEFADYGIRIDRQLVAFLECKRASTKLSSKHLRQVEMYAVNEGVEWMILTNGAHWQVYHLTPGMPVVIDLAFEVDLLSTTDGPTHKADKMFYLAKEALKRRQIDELWLTQAATSPKRLAEAILSDAVIAAIKTEVRRRSKQRVEEKDLRQKLQAEVLRTDTLA